jgi:hypothetical protein
MIFFWMKTLKIFLLQSNPWLVSGYPIIDNISLSLLVEDYISPFLQKEAIQKCYIKRSHYVRGSVGVEESLPNKLGRLLLKFYIN